MTLREPTTRKLFVSMMVSLDGFIEGPNRELDWHVQGEDFEQYCREMLNSIDLILLGRVSYEMMIGYWPAAEVNPSSPTELGFARRMNELPKVVLSTTLTSATWNTRVVKTDVPAAVRALKCTPGKDIAVFGGATIIATLREHGLVDEYRLIVTPVVLGSGTPLFRDVRERTSLRLTKTTTLSSGGIILYCEPNVT